ncbi:MAG: DUF4412 domain-containing protein [Chlorobiales bacterium]|jgi:hypothetical protein|nr:DUF4412 domain-containing protein [Chlorobiales bacterium]
MKRLTLLFLTAVTLFGFFLPASVTQAKGAFEGELEMTLNSPTFNGSATFVISSYGINVLVKSGNQSQTILILPDSKNVFRLNPAEKTYEELDLDAMQRQSAALSRLKQYRIEKLGTEAVLGYKCAHFTISDGTNQMELWTAKDFISGEPLKMLTSASQFLGVNSKMMDEMAKEVVDGFPVKMSAKVQGQTMSSQVTRVRKKRLKSGLFKLPSGYKPEK